MGAANVLFVCVHNAGRSQVSQLLFERRAGDHHSARSAGSNPADRVSPLVARLYPELADRKPRKISRDDVRWADVVVTMGCGDECPYIPGKRYVDWQIPDPSTKSTPEEIDPIARLLSDHIDRLLKDLG